jgi:hypothetical protein
LIQVASQFREMLLRAGDAREGSPVFRAWIQYIDTLLSVPTARERRLDLMLQADAWEERFLAMRLLAYVPVDKGRQIARKVADSDPEPIVRQYAASILELADLTPATQPAATQPGIMPSAPTDPSGMSLTPPATPAPTTPGDPNGNR